MLTVVQNESFYFFSITLPLRISDFVNLAGAVLQTLVPEYQTSHTSIESHLKFEFLPELHCH